MVRKPRDRRHIRRPRLVVALTLVFASASVSAQVVTELSDRSLAVGERLTYTLTIDHEEPADVTPGEVEFDGLRLIDGPTVRPVTILGDAERARAVEIRYTFQAAEAGRFILPPQTVVVAGQEYQTAERLVEIGERSNRSRVPYRARWTSSFDTLVVGQAVAVYLEVYNAVEYAYPNSLNVPVPPTAIMEEVAGLGTIEQSELDGVTLLTIPVAAFMLTPSAEGQVTLPAVPIVTGALEATAPELRIPVVAPPDSVTASGAVGDFHASVMIDSDSLAVGESANLVVRVEGTGNLHVLSMPEATFTGFVVEDDRRNTQFVPTDSGYSGYAEQLYVIRPEPANEYGIEVAPFVSYNAATGSVDRYNLTVSVPTVAEIRQPPAAEGEITGSALLDPTEIRSLERTNWYRRPEFYGWLSPGILFLIARRLWKRRNAAAVLIVAVSMALFVQARGDNLPWEEIERGNASYAEDDLEGAVTAYEAAARLAGESAGIQHNLAILYYQLDDIPRAVYAAREAIRLVPGAASLRETLRRIETGAGLDRTVPPPHHVHPDLFFVVLALAVNAIFIVAALARRPWRGRVTIAQITLMIVVLSSVAGISVAAVRHQHQLGVLRTDYLLRRIPRADSDGWLLVSAGTAVEVVAREGTMVLARNVLGLEGWIDETEVLWPGNPGIDVVRYRPESL
jgi:tetratricopeptide (TPR) repeat protein